MNRKLLTITLATIMVFSVLATVGVAKPAPGLSALTEVEIGFLSTQTGALETYHEGFENGANLALAEIQAAHSSITWTLTFYDTKTTPEGATEAMTAAVAAGSSFVIGAAGSSNTLAAAAIAKSEKIPLISYASTSPLLSDFDDGGYLWRVVPSDAFQGAAIADIALLSGYSTAVTLYVDNAYGAGVAAAFKGAFTGGTVSKEIAYDPENFEASALIDQIDAESPDVLIVIAYGVDGSKLFVQMADQRLNVPVIGGDGIADDAIFDESDGTQDAMMNVVATKPTAVGSDAVTAFEDAYAAAGYTGGIFTGEAYDAVWVGALAAIAADSNVGADINAKLSLTDYDGGSGKKKFDSNGDILAAAYLVMEVQEDGYTEIGTWNDGTLSLTGFTQEAAVVGTPFPILSFFFAIPVVIAFRKKNKK